MAKCGETRRVGGITRTIVCTREPGHQGDHQGYADQVDEVFFWPQPHASEYESAVREAHALLDAAGVPRADGAVCNDPNCNTKLGHRIKVALERGLLK